MSKGFSAECGPVTHDEANNIAMAYIDHCFGNKEKPGRRITHSIPANPSRDSDLRLAAYIDQQREKDERLARAVAIVEACLVWQEKNGACPFCAFIEADELGPGRPHDADCPLVKHGFVSVTGERL